MSLPLNTKIISEALEALRRQAVGILGFTILVQGGDDMGLSEEPLDILILAHTLNWYLTPIGFIMNLVDNLTSNAEVHRCEHCVRYEGAMTAVGIQVVGLMMFLRWRLAVVSWRSRLCLNFEPNIALDENKEAGHIIHTLFADGVIFYSVMCTINPIFIIMVVRAPEGLKNITGQLELILTVVMMSCITLSLKKEGTRDSVPLDTHFGSKFPLCFDCQRPVKDIMNPQPPAPSSQTSPMTTELFEMQSHAGAFDGDIFSQGQQDGDVHICFAFPAVTNAFDLVNNECSRCQEAMV
ncbi:uncharacterized protein F5147DRAFT_661555 [Suillus discolor]|uniref:Uncharacterized protein n=1 Tax=Suillus discolor TaxID=1912936 RepID=A0A9P7ERB2_9AGAM|nr:uncharacterized protein F5147DRAFT_661555 [Suillus discolor]KAG2079949.1 hypothetical protein F5147DRAFT_661555 [Suillus discolor]